MIRILANDGIQEGGKQLLIDAGFEVVTDHIPQEDLPNQLNNFDGILVRSATKVRKELIDTCPNIKFIGRGGVGMDNIDVEYAREKGINVSNTPAASSQSVAELVFAQLFTGVRFLYDANRKMPVNGEVDFKSLKKAYSKGIELSGKTIGIIGFGGIGQAVAKMAVGLGMNVIPCERTECEKELEINFYNDMHSSINLKMHTKSMDYLLANSDFITLHIPFKSGSTPVIGANEFAKMKDGAMIVNTARGGAVCENSMLNALNSGKLSFAGIDVFENEPTPRKDLLAHPKVSPTPHIGGSTQEAQARVWVEMADKIIKHFS